jgi:predicted DCC family thiol-disulfide oxidoreductase YuxK
VATLVLYDGGCELCKRSLAILQRLDWRHRLTFADARDRAVVPAGLDPMRLMAEMHVIAQDGRVDHGFRAFRRLAWELPPLWLLLPFLYVPGVPTVGQRLYLWVARNRYHLVPCHDGACAVAGKKLATDEHR